jgi:hypothetical protein
MPDRFFVVFETGAISHAAKIDNNFGKNKKNHHKTSF